MRKLAFFRLSDAGATPGERTASLSVQATAAEALSHALGGLGF